MEIGRRDSCSLSVSFFRVLQFLPAIIRENEKFPCHCIGLSNSRLDMHVTGSGRDEGLWCVEAAMPVCIHLRPWCRLSMEAGVLREYFDYLSRVLGVRSILIPNAQTSSDLKKVLYIDQSPWTSEQSELFGKMRKAMAISDHEYDVVYRSERSEDELKLKANNYMCVIEFSQERQVNESHAWYKTYGPVQLLNDSSLKKAAWADLQLIMKRFS
jgi:hypothetical protein